MSFRLLVQRIASALPEVDKPKRRVSIRNKLIWTGIVAVLYLIMTEIPLYGVRRGGYDPLAFYRVILASTRGTLMELGIGPIVTAGLIMELLVGGELIKLDLSKPEDRAFFTSATKILTLVFAFIESVVFLISGFFGQELTLSTSIVIIIQLMIATLIIMYLDELLQKGWGIGSGISLFIVLGVSNTIFWMIFSPIPVSEGDATVPYGLVPYLIYLATTGNSLLNSLVRNGYYPSIVALIATILTALIIIYVEGIRVEIPISYARYRGFRGRYPVKLLYVSNIPVILASAMIYNIYAFSRVIWAKFNPNNSNQLLNMIGTFNATDPSQPATGGLAYYLMPSPTINGVLSEPVRSIAFVLIMCALSTLFAIVWVQVGRLSPESVSQQLIDAGMQVPGFRRRSKSIAAILERYISTVTIIGGLLVGLIAGVGQLAGVFGGGIGILLTIDILLQYYQVLVREQIEEMYPFIGKLIG